MRIPPGVPWRPLLLSFVLAACLAPAGCGGCDTCDEGLPGGGTPFTQAPDFTLQDENPNSATYQAPVSPRDHVGRVSAWYFGWAT